MTWTRWAVLLAFCSTLLVSISAQTVQRAAISHQEFLRGLVAAAVERTYHSVRYDPAYVRIPYPGGDVPADTGVCTDEVIRSYRAVGVDLQKEVHEDMLQIFSAYPLKWHGLSGHPDTNIDHRRVPNLMVFFQRHGETLPITSVADDYRPGDLVTWNLGGGVPHIGIVVDRKGTGGRDVIVHNIGRPANGRRTVQLENHRSLSLLWPVQVDVDCVREARNRRRFIQSMTDSPLAEFASQSHRATPP